MLLTDHRVHIAVTDMTELIGPAQVHDRAGSGSNNEGRLVPRRALLSFQRPLRRGRRVSPPRCARLGHEKGPSSRGPGMAAGVPGRSGLLLRGCSSRDPKQERPRSIDRESAQMRARRVRG